MYCFVLLCCVYNLLPGLLTSLWRCQAVCPQLFHHKLSSVQLEYKQWTVAKLFISDVIIGVMAFQITILMIVDSMVYSGADQRKHQSSASLAFVRGIHRWPVNSLHKGPVTQEMFPLDDVIIEPSGPVVAFCGRTISMHLPFLSFFHTDMIQVIEIVTCGRQ